MKPKESRTPTIHPTLFTQLQKRQCLSNVFLCFGVISTWLVTTKNAGAVAIDCHACMQINETASATPIWVNLWLLTSGAIMFVFAARFIKPISTWVTYIQNTVGVIVVGYAMYSLVLQAGQKQGVFPDIPKANIESPGK